MYRKLHLDFETLGRMHVRGLSDPAIGRVLGCSRQTVLNYRHRLGLASRYNRGRNHPCQADHQALDRIWARLSLEEKRGLLLQSKEEAE